MTRFARHAVLLLALTAATPAFAQDWRVAAISGAKPDRSVYLVDASSVVRKGDTVDFQTQSIFEGMTEARDFDRSVTQRHGVCSTHSSQIMVNTYYGGGAFQSTDNAPGNMIAHKQGTVMYDVIDQVCGVSAMEQGTVANPEAAVRNYFANQ